MKNIAIVAIVATIAVSCTKRSVSLYNPAKTAHLTVEFDNIVGSADLQLQTGNYVNGAGEQFKVTKFKYYVSNFILTNANGTTFMVPQDSCYFLIDESVPASRTPVLKVPEGEYTKLSFTIGIDSLRNTMDISKRVGVLDPTLAAADMYWSWNSGYIFLKLEGTSSAISTMSSTYQYHAGGFGGYSTPTTNNIKTIALDLTPRGVAQVKEGKKTNIHIMADVQKALQGTTTFSFASTAMIHNATAGRPLADNYANMFKHDHTEN